MPSSRRSMTVTLIKAGLLFATAFACGAALQVAFTGCSIFS